MAAVVQGLYFKLLTSAGASGLTCLTWYHHSGVARTGWGVSQHCERMFAALTAGRARTGGQQAR
jgi:hypothetical protein